MGRSFALSAFVHLVLLAVMFLGVRLQSSAPAVVNVELWDVPPPPPRVVEAPKPPPPVLKPQPEPEPEVKKPPEIALPEKPKAKPKPKPVPPKRDLALEKQMREQAMLEERQLQDRLIREQAAQAAAALRNRALLQWTDKIRAKIRSKIFLLQEVPGNPEAIFDVTLLPTGEVLTVNRRKSSGNPGYDAAVERAIINASPLPLPDDRSLFQRQLQLRFRPQDR